MSVVLIFCIRLLSFIPLCAQARSYACHCRPKPVDSLYYSWQQIFLPEVSLLRSHPKPRSALMSRTCSGNTCEMWVQTCAGWLSHSGPIWPCSVNAVKSLCQQASLSNAAVIQVVWGIFIEMCLVGIWKLRCFLSALMLTPELSSLRLEPGCNHPSYFCNEEYVQSQAKHILEEMNYQTNIDYFILRDIIQST